MEAYIYRQYVICQYLHWEWQYDEYVAGTLNRDSLPADGWRVVVDWDRSEIHRDAWSDYKQSTESRLDLFL